MNRPVSYAVAPPPPDRTGVAEQVLTPHGPIDEWSAVALLDALVLAVAQARPGCTVVLSLEDVPAIDDAGLQALRLMAGALGRLHCALTLVHPRAGVARRCRDAGLLPPARRPGVPA